MLFKFIVRISNSPRYGYQTTFVCPRARRSSHSWDRQNWPRSGCLQPADKDNAKEVYYDRYNRILPWNWQCDALWECLFSVIRGYLEGFPVISSATCLAIVGLTLAIRMAIRNRNEFARRNQASVSPKNRTSPIPRSSVPPALKPSAASFSRSIRAGYISSCVSYLGATIP